MSDGHSANSRVLLTSFDWLKVVFIQDPVAADTSHSGTNFDHSDARRHEPFDYIRLRIRAVTRASVIHLLFLSGRDARRYM